MANPWPRPDAAWLRGVLARGGHDAEGVTLASSEPVSAGNTSEILRLTLAGARGALPETLVAKVPRLLPDGTAPPADIFGYDREVAAYRAFGPAQPFRIPRAWAAEQDKYGFTLLLEDLSAGCRPGDQIGGCGIGDARAVLRELAALHARYWRSPEIDALDWPSHRWRNAERTATLYAAGAVVVRQRYGGYLDEAALAAIDAAAPLIRGWAATKPFASTLIHADPRVDNIIFVDGEAGGSRACLIDLQSISIGDAAFDLAYFLTGSLEPDERAACEADLIAAHAAIVRRVDPTYDDALAWTRYRQFAICGLVGTLSAAGVLGERANMHQIGTLARRNCAAVIALDGVAGAQERMTQGEG